MRLLIALLALFAAGASAPVEPHSARAEQAMRGLAVNGFAGSVLVACGDRVLFAGDYGLREAQGREPSYWVASISKQFTATAILQLARAGKLSLDDHITRFFPNAPTDKAAITLTALLEHTSGLTQAYAADGVADRAQAAHAILAGPLASIPGATFHYSNDNYTLLAMIVEIASRQRFEDYVREHEFAPAGLQHAGFWPDTGEDFAPPTLVTLNGPASRANWGFRGGTGMRVSVADLYRWARALDTNQVLSPDDVALLYGPHTQASDGDGVGFGWFWSDTNGERWLWTRGSDSSGYNAVLYRRAGTALIVIAATNAGPAESAGPGYSRLARDALTPIFDDGSCR